MAGTFISTLNKLSNLREIWILSINQSNVKINKRTEYWPIRLQVLSLLSNVSERVKVAGFFYVLIMTEIPDFSLHLFDDSDFQMESLARFPEIDVTDLLEMRENNSKKHKNLD